MSAHSPSLLETLTTKVEGALGELSSAKLSRMPGEELRMHQQDVHDWTESIRNLISKAEESDSPVSDELRWLMKRTDELSKRIAEIAAKRFVITRKRYDLSTTPTLVRDHFNKPDKKNFDAAVREKRKEMDEEWKKRIKQHFEASAGATLSTRAGIEGRRLGTPYIWNIAQAIKLRRKKEAFDQLTAIRKVYEDENSGLQASGKTLEYVIKAGLGTSITILEQGFLSFGSAILLILGGPGAMVLTLSWNAMFGLLPRILTEIARGLGTIDRFLNGLVENAWDVWSSAGWLQRSALAIPFIILGLGKAVFFLSTTLISGISSILKAIDISIGDFAKKNVVPLLGLTGTAVGAYFLTMALVAGLTAVFPVVLVSMAVAAGCMLIGAVMVAYMKVKSKVKKAANQCLSPDEEAMLMRFDYEETVRSKPTATLQQEAQKTSREEIPVIETPTTAARLTHQFTSAASRLSEGADREATALPVPDSSSPHPPVLPHGTDLGRPRGNSDVARPPTHVPDTPPQEREQKSKRDEEEVKERKDTLDKLA